MSDNIPAGFEELNAELLTPIVQQALGKEDCTVVDFQAELVSRNDDTPAQVLRVKGTGQCGDQVVPWSLFLKRAAYLEEDDPAAAAYWKREVYGYKSGFLAQLPGGIAAPRCYSISKRANGDYWLWLEDIRDDFSGDWPLEHYRAAARKLGHFNGAYLCGRTVPNQLWITRGWLRKQLESYAPQVEFARANPTHPAVRAVLPAGQAGMLFRLWDARGKLLDILDGMPQTFCHQWITLEHLYARGDQIILLDWESMGFAPVGAEMVTFVAANVALSPRLTAQARQLDRLAFQGYYEGLREAGYVPDEKTVRLAYVISLSLRFPFTILGLALPQLLAVGEEGLQQKEQEIKAPFTATQRQIASYWLACGREMLRRLGLFRSARIFFTKSGKSAARPPAGS